MDVQREGPPRFPGDPAVEGDDDLDAQDQDLDEDSEPEQEGTPIVSERRAREASAPEGEPPSQRQRVETESQPASEPQSLPETPPSRSSTVFPYPFDRSTVNHYIESEENTNDTFFIEEATALFQNGSFFIKKLSLIHI